jgi:hypothetical protein
MSLATIGELFRVKHPHPTFEEVVAPPKDVTPAGTLFFGSPPLYPGEQKTLIGFECQDFRRVWFSRLDVSFRTADGGRQRSCIFIDPIELREVNRTLMSRRPLVDRGGWELRVIPKTLQRVSGVCVTPVYGR